jgi:hypothetical protein
MRSPKEASTTLQIRRVRIATRVIAAANGNDMNHAKPLKVASPLL